MIYTGNRRSSHVHESCTGVDIMYLCSCTNGNLNPCDCTSADLAS
jgi:hypothetical protein